MGQVERKDSVHNFQRWYTFLALGFEKGFDKQQRARVPSGQKKLVPKGRNKIVSRDMWGKDQ